MEVESALWTTPVLPKPRWWGRPTSSRAGLAAFVTLKEGQAATLELKETQGPRGEEDRRHRRPDAISSVETCQTRSGKIMRRLLKDIAEGRTLGDTTTLATRVS